MDFFESKSTQKTQTEAVLKKLNLIINSTISDSTENQKYFQVKNIQEIPLSYLFKNKLNHKIQCDSNIFKPLEEKSNNEEISSIYKNLGIKNNINYFKSMSQKKFSIQNTKRKLPMIKCYCNQKLKKNSFKNEVKGNSLWTIFHKLKLYDKKFKEQGHLSERIINKGNKDLKLSNKFIQLNAPKRDSSFMNKGYKKDYSKLLLRIKQIRNF